MALPDIYRLYRRKGFNRTDYRLNSAFALHSLDLERTQQDDPCMTTGQAADIQVALRGHIKGGDPRPSVTYGVFLKMEQGRALLYSVVSHVPSTELRQI